MVRLANLAAALGEVYLVASDCWRWCRGDNLLAYKPSTYSLDYHEVAVLPLFNFCDLAGADLEVLGDLEYHWVAFSGEGVALDLSGRERRFVFVSISNISSLLGIGKCF